ncbi:MAG: MFS transporter [Gammaproteobacteria bacterium]
MQREVIAMLFLGFSAGIPILLIFSSLSLWLLEAGVERSAVTFFSWAALGYSFKFVWAPLVDTLPLPVLHRLLGRRRSWLLLSQCAIVFSILLMSSTDPAVGVDSLTIMAVAAVLLGFSSATQDIVIDAYRIESAPSAIQALLSSTYIAGYRIGMLVAGAGALFLASILGSQADQYSYVAWQETYMIMASLMLVGILTTILIKEPVSSNKRAAIYGARDYASFLLFFLLAAGGFVASFFYSAGLASDIKQQLMTLSGNKYLAAFIVELMRLSMALFVVWVIARVLTVTNLINQEMVRSTYFEPVKDFFSRYGTKVAVLLLLLIGLYRISDIVLGVISNVFYQDLGFTKIEIASIVKTFGLFMTLAGGFLGGVLSIRYGVIRILFLGALLSATTNLLFMLLAQAGHHTGLLYLVISADNLSGGLATAAFVAFLSSLTNMSFTAVQYAIFSSLMTLLPKILGGYSGSMVDSLSYSGFFAMTALMGLPVIFLIWLLVRVLPDPS